MSSKPETTFYNSVHKHLPPESELHREKMANPYRGGTADFWFSSKKDLWTEYKFIVLPRRADTIIDLCGGRHPSISALQQDWLESRHIEGRNVWVIVGCKEGGVIMTLPVHWKKKWQAADFRSHIYTRAELAREIDLFTKGHG